MRKRCIVSMVLLVCVVAAASQVEAQVIYSNFGPDMAFDTNPYHGWGINGLISPGVGRQAISQRFTPSVTAAFTGAKVALSLLSGPENVSVFLQADSDGLPGPVLERIDISGLTGIPAVFAAPSTLSPLLVQGMPYWLTVVAFDAGVLAGWSWNSVGDICPEDGDTFAVTQDGSPLGFWGFNPFPTTRGAFQIEGEPIPSITVAIDIKPGDSQNAINLASTGVIPVAILSSSSFNAMDVDPATISLAGASVKVAGKSDRYLSHVEDVNGDGLPDLVCQVYTSQLGIEPGTATAVLEAKMFDTRLIRGQDAITIMR